MQLLAFDPELPLLALDPNDSQAANAIQIQERISDKKSKRSKSKILDSIYLIGR